MAKTTDDKKPEAGTRQQRLPLTWDDSSAPGQSDLSFAAKQPADESQSPSTEEDKPASPPQCEVVPPPLPDTDAEEGDLPEPSPPGDIIPPAEVETESPPLPLPPEGYESPFEEAEEEPAEPAVETSADAEDQADEQVPELAPAEAAPPAEVQIIELGKVEMTLGQRLMEARGACNLTITNVAQKTRIPKHIIEQIETDRIKQLPPPIYTRSYVAQLCREYTIDPQPILSELDRLLQRGDEDSDTHQLVVTAQDSESGSKVQYRLAGKQETNGSRVVTPTMMAVVAAVVVLAILIVASLGLKKWRRHMKKQEVIEAVEVIPMPAAPVDLEEFIIPQQIPLKELAIPAD